MREKPRASRTQRGKKNSYNNQQTICIRTLDVWPYSRLFIPLISENDATLHGTIEKKGEAFVVMAFLEGHISSNGLLAQLLRPDQTDQFLGGQTY